MFTGISRCQVLPRLIITDTIALSILISFYISFNGYSNFSVYLSVHNVSALAAHLQGMITRDWTSSLDFFFCC